MSVNLLPISAVCTVLSFLGLRWWTASTLEKLRLDGLIGESQVHSGNASRALELLLGSGVAIALLANLAFHVFTFMILCLKVSLLLSLLVTLYTQLCVGYLV